MKKWSLRVSEWRDWRHSFLLVNVLLPVKVSVSRPPPAGAFSKNLFLSSVVPSDQLRLWTCLLWKIFP